MTQWHPGDEIDVPYAPPAPFAVGDVVETIKGAKFWGEVVSVYPVPKRFSGTEWRCDVYATAPGFEGTLHVYPATQLALCPAAQQPAELAGWQHRIYYDDTCKWSDWKDGKWSGLLANLFEERPLYAAAPRLRSFQDRVAQAHVALFHDDPTDLAERRDRFYEESTEVVQSLGMTEDEAHQLVSYTFSRPPGDVRKEIGAAVVTLASACVVGGWDMMECAEADLAALCTPEKVAKVRAKRATRHGRGPLPGFDSGALRSAIPEPSRPVVSVKTMRKSGDRADYFVSIAVDGRDVTPHVFTERYKAEYHVALYDWLLNGGDEPDLMAFGPDDWPARKMPIEP